MVDFKVTLFDLAKQGQRMAGSEHVEMFSGVKIAK
jgi:hypothetical protein